MTAVAEFGYYITEYQDALRTLERTFDQPYAVLSAHSDIFSQFLLQKMHNSENSSYSATISALVGVF